MTRRRHAPFAPVNDLDAVLLTMETLGGHFLRKIAEAYRYADSVNRAKLVDAFREEFARADDLTTLRKGLQ